MPPSSNLPPIHETFLALLDRNLDHAAAFDDSFDDLQDDQHPHTVSVCCSDSRVL